MNAVSEPRLVATRPVANDQTAEAAEVCAEDLRGDVLCVSLRNSSAPSAVKGFTN